MNAAPKLSLAVQYASNAEHLPTRHQFRRWVKAALQRDACATLRIVDEAEGHELNRNYRGKDYATNVLTFVYDDAQAPSRPPSSTSFRTGLSGEKPVLSGDIVICAPVVEKEAREQHKELYAHYAHLTIHALLHLQGYDHENEADAAAMEARETAILMKLGYADPYQIVTL